MFSSLSGLFWIALVACLAVYLGWQLLVWVWQSTSAADVPHSREARPTLEDDLRGAERLLEYARFQNWLTAEQDELLAANLQRLRERVASQAETGPVAAPQSPAVRSPAASAAASPSSLQTEPPLIQAVVVEEDRTRNVAASAVHPLDQLEPERESRGTPPSVPKRLLGDILRSFMERANIRWVELISATLVVVCSVGLVISLWSTLSRTSRFFPSLVFMLATLAVHGAGQYTLRRWKLRTTSRGILHIGLMLIPLAMLVGILLSTRGGLPELNLSSILALVIGGTVYSGLAITASRVLFPRRYALVAASTIIASATLVAVHYFAARDVGPLPAAGLLVPIVILSSTAALVLGGRCVARQRWTPAFVRRHLGTTTQILFAVLTACIFWYLQFQESSAITPWWWTLIGIVAVGWSGWGWIASFSRPGRSDSRIALTEQRSTTRGSDLDISWMIVAAWTIGIVGTLFLLVCCWQASLARPSLIALLAVGSVWWWLQGATCRLSASLLVGSLAGIVAVALLAETLQLESRQATLGPLRAVDWISFERITWLTVASGLAAVCGLAMPRQRGGGGRLSPAQSTKPQEARPPETVQWSLLRTRTLLADLRLVCEQLALAGGIGIMAAAALTMVASAVPWGQTPYGGNWAALSLAAYGIAITAAGIALDGRHTSIGLAGSSSIRRFGFNRWLVPAGQALSILAMVRLCQTSSLLPEWIDELRPGRAWAVGLTTLAVAWALLAIALTQLGFSSAISARANRIDWRAIDWRSIDWLSTLAIAIALVSAPAVWRWSDRLELAATVGWTLPIVIAGVWWSWRAAVARELLLIAFCGWGCAWLFHTGDMRNWWNELGLAGSAAVHAAVCLIATGVFVGLSKAMRSQRYPAWITAGLAWGVPSVVIVCLVALLGASAVPAVPHLAASLGYPAVEAAEAASEFALRSPDALGLAALVISIALLVGITLYASILPDLLWLRAVISFAPLVAALAVAAWGQVPSSLVMSAWLLAVALLTSELAAFLGEPWPEQSQRAWEQPFQPRVRCAPRFQWLSPARSLAFAALLCLSLLAIIQGWHGALVPELLPALSDRAWSDASWMERTSRLLVWLGPLLSVVGVRWLLSVIGDASSQLIQASGSLLALTAACLCSLTVTAQAFTWVFSSVAFLQAASIACAALAALTAAFPLARNYLALKTLSAGAMSAGGLLRKAVKGGRWKRAETSAWSLVVQGWGILSALCTVAAVSNAWYPVESLATLEAISRWPSPVAYAAVTLMLVAIGRLRSISRFGLLAIALGMLAPLTAAFYAEWLDADPTRLSLAARRFEPYRAQIVLWLLALAAGLAVRLRAREQAFSRASEGLWVGLAFVVGLLGWVSIVTDRQKIWPAAELNALALLTVLSGLVSGRTWRGHIAALVAASGILAWHFTAERFRGINPMWLPLWGPVWVGLVAIAWTLARQPAAHERDAITADQSRPRRLSRSVDQTVSVHVPLAICILTGIWVLSTLDPATARVGLNLPWVAALSVAVVILAVARLWDWRSGRRGVAIYIAVLCAALTCAVIVGEFAETPFLTSSLLWMAAGLSALAIVAGALREWMRESSRLLPALHLGAIEGRQDQFLKARAWIVPLHTTIGIVLLAPCVLLVLNFHERSLRLATAALPFLSALSILPIALEPARRLPRAIGLLLISTACVLVAWGDLPYSLANADADTVWQYFERTFVALVALAWVYAWLSEVMRGKLDWQWLLHRAGWIGILLGSVCGAIMLAVALSGDWADAARFAATGDKLLILTAWGGVIARCLQLALRPRGLDQRVPMRTRQGAVYAAELGLGFLTAAAYCAYPDLFGGVLARWWPIIVYAVAMSSAAVGQWCERVGQRIVSDPVLRSSLLLPVLPLVGVWWPSAQLQGIDWSDWQRFSLLLIIAAALYGMHGWLRPSLGLRALSACLTMLAFWALLYSHPELRFFEHPQFWLLPPAVATLIFVEVSRQRLEPTVVTAVRYIAILVAYLSSTADMFLKAFEGQLWQPLVLLLLAVAGLLAGIALRVRAFLFSGSCFVLIALLGMVWHAQQAIDQVWPWWAFGILTGVSLIAMLGYFEKNRPRVLAYVEQLKSWEY